MTQDNVAITGEPITDAMCRFTVDQPVYPDKSFYFGSKEQAEGSALAERLFAIEGVKGVQISHNQVTVRKTGVDEWPVIGKQVGAAIRAFLATNEPVVSDEVRQKIPPSDDIRERVQQVLDSEINPSVAGHGGMVRLIDVKDNVVYIQMGGGCQGCGQADVTLKYGIETAIRAAVDGVGDILDVTDHAAGRNPYYVPSAK
jgi:Fe-S cluster biogenesis protein NfuA